MIYITQLLLIDEVCLLDSVNPWKWHSHPHDITEYCHCLPSAPFQTLNKLPQFWTDDGATLNFFLTKKRLNLTRKRQLYDVDSNCRMLNKGTTTRMEFFFSIYIGLSSQQGSVLSIWLFTENTWDFQNDLEFCQFEKLCNC